VSKQVSLKLVAVQADSDVSCCALQDQIQALGPWGGALFVLTVMSAEMVPLFPTQPLSLASGLLFGPVNVRWLQRLQL